MNGNLKTRKAFSLFICAFIVPLLTIGQSKGLLFNDESYQTNIRKQYIGPSFQEESLPFKFSLRSHCPFPKNQGTMGSCVGWAVGYGAYTISDAVQHNLLDRKLITSNAFSALFIYNQIKILGCDSGSYIHSALTLAKQRGNCTLSLFNPDNCDDQPAQTINTTKIIDSQSLFSKFDSKETKLYAVKQKISSKYPVIIGFETNTKFSSTFINKSNPIWTSGGKNDGGHAVVVVGYDDTSQMFEILNSWGNDFGDNGFFWMKYDDFIKYTHYAAILILAKSMDSEVIATAGNVTLRNFDNSQKRLEDVNVYKTNNCTYKTAKPTWSKGDIFQLLISNKDKNQFLYAFSINNNNKVNIHFPRRSEYNNTNDKENNTNESEFFSQSLSKLYIPNENRGMQINSSSEILCVLFSKSQIKDFKTLTSNISAKYSGDDGNDVYDLLKELLNTRLAPMKDVLYSQNNIEFNAKVNVDKIIPIIINIKAQ